MEEKTIGGRLSTRRTTAKIMRSSSRKGGLHYLGYRLKLTERSTRLHFTRSLDEDGNKILYPNPEIEDLWHEWKIGKSYFVKTQTRPKGMPVEWSPKNNLIEAYRFPAQYGVEDREELSAGAFLKEFYPKLYFCTSGWVEEWYHLVQVKKKDGSGTYTDRIRCEGKGCKHCEEKWPRVFGNRFWIDFSPGQWTNVIDRTMEEMDRLPLEGGYVYPSHYECEGCGEILSFTDEKSGREYTLDLTNSCDCGATGEDIGLDAERHMAVCQLCGQEWTLLTHENGVMKSSLDKELKCNNCGHVGYAKGVFKHIPQDEDGEELEEWTPVSLFDAQVTMFREAGTEKKNGNINITNWKVQEPDPRLFDPRYQGWDGNPKNVDEKKIAEMWVQRHKQTLNLNDIHQVLDPDEVADKLGLCNILAPAPSKKRQEFQPRVGRIKKKK